MSRANWKLDENKVAEVMRHVWYRSPLWDQDHMEGNLEKGTAWCGRALDVALHMDNELGGLWVSNRKTGKCSECVKKENEWMNGQ